MVLIENAETKKLWNININQMPNNTYQIENLCFFSIKPPLSKSLSNRTSKSYRQGDNFAEDFRVVKNIFQIYRCDDDAWRSILSPGKIAGNFNWKSPAALQTIWDQFGVRPEVDRRAPVFVLLKSSVADGKWYR